MFTTASGAQAASHVSYGCSNMVFTGPAASSLPLGAWAAAGGRNALGARTAVIELSSGVGGAFGRLF